MQYDEKIHGYHKETANEVLASGIKIDEHNAGNFRTGMTLKQDFEFLNQKAMESMGVEEEFPQQEATENLVTDFGLYSNF
jgi:hypothetical protein